MKSLIRIIITFNTVALLMAVAAMPVMAQSTKTTAPSVEVASYSQAELDQMLAPIALYPDSVLSHLLIAATYPLEIVMANRWAEKNSNKTGDDAINAVDDEEWDASVKALVAFPTVLKRLSDDLEWTESVGEAFLADESVVLQTIQNLRQQAYDEGNLENLDHLKVTTEDEEIVIEPAYRDVVYIPVYNTRIVYGPWRWNDYPPVYWHHDDFYYRRSHVVYWGPSVYLSHSFFFSGFHWRNHHVVVVDRRYRNRYRNHYYSNRRIVRHQHANRWQHDRRHRRGVEYRNPRTRDYFERKDRDTRMINARSERSARQIEHGLRRNDRVTNSSSQTRSARDASRYTTRDERARSERVNRDRSREERSRDQRSGSREERPRAERSSRATSERGDSPKRNESRRSENERRNSEINKERFRNDSRNVNRDRDAARAREVRRASDDTSRREMRVESARERRTEQKINTRAIRERDTRSIGNRDRSERQNTRASRSHSESASRGRAIRERRER